MAGINTLVYYFSPSVTKKEKCFVALTPWYSMNSKPETRRKF